MTNDVAPSTRPFDSSPAGPPRPGPDRVPIDERVGGLDRRSFWPGIVMLVVWAIWAHAMPWIDNQISLDDPIVAGDVINLSQGELTFVPAVGWNLDSGLRVSDGADRVGVPSSSAVSSDLVSYSVAVGPWEGTPDELLDRMLKINEGLDNLIAKDEQGRESIANADGEAGRLVYVKGADQSVLIAAFVFQPEAAAGGSTPPGIGVEIEVRGQTVDFQDQVQEIASMIVTTTYRPTSQEAQP
mgnify:CR=1 FL=1